MSGTRQGPATVEGITRRVSRFYWGWLIFATTVSVLGNITHAVLVAPGAVKLLAAVASVVPPAFLVGSTHAAALSLRARRFALTYVLGLSMTIGVAACAFLLSFDALRGLAVILGWPSGRAWLFPIAIDVSISQATFGLLSLAPARANSAAEQSTAALAEPDSTSPEPTTNGAQKPFQPAAFITVCNDEVVDVGHPPRQVLASGAPEAVPAVAMSESPPPLIAATDSPGTRMDMSELLRWKPTAHQLVRNGTTSKDPEIVAAILAEHAAGAPPSTISRRRGVHHSTVGRILAGAAALAG
ncbi:MAG: hypothetical protein QOJ56_2366 [Mycobacterium sp.]|jgi:hypothetical protein|nr:hypothetical protein [Mycobacterium sp.]